MVGLIQKIMMDLIGQLGGQQAVGDVLVSIGLPRDFQFRIDTNYDDEQACNLIAAVCKHFNLTAEQAYEAYADFFLKDVLQRFPAFFAMSKSGYDFLQRQISIHNSIGAGIAGSDPAIRQRISAKFRIEHIPNGILTNYTSRNRLGGLYVALARRVIAHFGDDAEVITLDPTDQERCRIQVIWPNGLPKVAA